MSIFQRAHDIVRAKANKALDAAERPDGGRAPELLALATDAAAFALG